MNTTDLIQQGKIDEALEVERKARIKARAQRILSNQDKKYDIESVYDTILDFNFKDSHFGQLLSQIATSESWQDSALELREFLIDQAEILAEKHDKFLLENEDEMD